MERHSLGITGMLRAEEITHFEYNVIWDLRIAYQKNVSKDIKISDFFVGIC